MTLVLVNGREIRLDWKQDGETCRFRVESDVEKAAEVRQVEPGVYSVLVGGRSYQVRIEGAVVSIAGRSYSVEVLDPRRWNRNRNHQIARAARTSPRPCRAK